MNDNIDIVSLSISIQISITLGSFTSFFPFFGCNVYIFFNTKAMSGLTTNAFPAVLSFLNNLLKSNFSFSFNMVLTSSLNMSCFIRIFLIFSVFASQELVNLSKNSFVNLIFSASVALSSLFVNLSLSILINLDKLLNLSSLFSLSLLSPLFVILSAKYSNVYIVRCGSKSTIKPYFFLEQKLLPSQTSSLSISVILLKII